MQQITHVAALQFFCNWLMLRFSLAYYPPRDDEPWSWNMYLKNWFKTSAASDIDQGLFQSSQKVTRCCWKILPNFVELVRFINSNCIYRQQLLWKEVLIHSSKSFALKNSTPKVSPTFFLGWQRFLDVFCEVTKTWMVSHCSSVVVLSLFCVNSCHRASAEDFRMCWCLLLTAPCPLPVNITTLLICSATIISPQSTCFIHTITKPPGICNWIVWQ